MNGKMRMPGLTAMFFLAAASAANAGPENALDEAWTQLSRAASVNTTRAKTLALAPVRVSYAEDGTNEPSNLADPKLGGDYTLKKISKRRSSYVSTREYCPDRVRVVVNDPAVSVSVYGKMDDGSGGDSREQPGYFHLTGFTAKRWSSSDKYDEVAGRTRSTVFNGRSISETESGFLVTIGGFVVDSTVMRLGFFDSDALILKHSESATALLVVPVGAIIGNDDDYSCEYKRVKPAQAAPAVTAIRGVSGGGYPVSLVVGESFVKGEAYGGYPVDLSLTRNGSACLIEGTFHGGYRARVRLEDGRASGEAMGGYPIDLNITETAVTGVVQGGRPVDLAVTPDAVEGSAMGVKLELTGPVDACRLTAALLPVIHKPSGR